MRFVVEEMALEEVSLDVIQHSFVSSIRIISTMIHINLHLLIVLTRRTKEPSLETFQKAKFFLKSVIITRTSTMSPLDIGRSVYHFVQYMYIPTRYTM